AIQHQAIDAHRAVGIEIIAAFAERSLNLRELLPQLGTQHPRIRTHYATSELLDILDNFDLTNIELVGDLSQRFFRQKMASELARHRQRRKRLADRDFGLAAGSST